MIDLNPESFLRVRRQLRQAERMANVGSWRLTLADNRTEWSDQVYTIHGLPIGESPPLDGALDFYPQTSREIITTALARTIDTGQPFDIETDFVTACGLRRRVRVAGELELHGGSPVAIIGVFQDITSRFELEEALRRSAYTDELTGLANRAAFNAALETRITAARRGSGALALLLIDLDAFKSVNDRFGHRGGDELLIRVAQRLQSPDFDGCFVARFGGDEFVVIVSAADKCARLDRLIAQLLGDLRIAVDSAEALTASATIGAAWLDASVDGRSDLIHHADAALYAAKHAQRGTARIFGEDRMIVAATRSQPQLLSVVG